MASILFGTQTGSGAEVVCYFDKGALFFFTDLAAVYMESSLWPGLGRLKKIGALFFVHPSRKHDIFVKIWSDRKYEIVDLHIFIFGIFISNYKTFTKKAIHNFFLNQKYFFKCLRYKLFKNYRIKKTPCMILLLLQKIAMIEEYRKFEFVTKTPFLSKTFWQNRFPRLLKFIILYLNLPFSDDKGRQGSDGE